MEYLKNAMLVVTNKKGSSVVHCKISTAAEKVKTTQRRIAEAIHGTGKYETDEWLITKTKRPR